MISRSQRSKSQPKLVYLFEFKMSETALDSIPTLSDVDFDFDEAEERDEGHDDLCRRRILFSPKIAEETTVSLPLRYEDVSGVDFSVLQTD
jgi:hypothetical protein